MNDKPPEPAMRLVGKCGHCHAWFPVEQSGPRPIGEVKVGLCKLIPPTPVLVADMRGRERGQRNVWPCMPEHEFCLSFLPRDNLLQSAVQSGLVPKAD